MQRDKRRDGGKFNETETKLKQTCSTIQRQHIRTNCSSCTLLLVRIASAMARMPTSPILLSTCEIMRMRGGDGGNKTETNVQHNSATTHTHKVQYLHTAVGANRVCNGAHADVADGIPAL
jgi:hypothetical protein